MSGLPPLHSSAEPNEPDVDALLAFQTLKDTQNPDALQVWNAYQKSGDTATLNKSILVLLNEHRNAKPKPLTIDANAPLPPGGIDSYPDEGMCSRIDLSLNTLRLCSVNGADDMSREIVIFSSHCTCTDSFLCFVYVRIHHEVLSLTIFFPLCIITLLSI